MGEHTGKNHACDKNITKAILSTFIFNTNILKSKDVSVITVAGVVTKRFTDSENRRSPAKKENPVSCWLCSLTYSYYAVHKIMAKYF